MLKRFTSKKEMREFDRKKNTMRRDEAEKKPVTTTSLRDDVIEARKKRNAWKFEVPNKMDDGKNMKLGEVTEESEEVKE